MARVLRTRLANEDLIQIWSHIALEKLSPGAADSLLHELDETIQLIAQNPMLGESVEQYGADLRLFTRHNYLIFYRPIENGIEVYRLLHGARAWQELL